VLGLGETLVSGNYPGRALGFVYDKTSHAVTVQSYPNKSVKLVSEDSWIFRSDSNTEDLASFAGAGVFESYILHEPV
jgi:hypothetical protein